MPMMTIRAVNAEFESSDAREFDSVDAAYRVIVKTGVEIAAAEILSGRPACAVELLVEIDGIGVKRGAVSMSVAQLMVERSAGL